MRKTIYFLHSMSVLLPHVVGSGHYVANINGGIFDAQNDMGVVVREYIRGVGRE